MARKRATDPASGRQQPRNGDLNAHHTSPRGISPDNKMDNLKTLNQLLLKETMDKRSQIDQLKAHIDDVEESLPFASDIEREVSRVVLASAMAEEAKKVRSLREMLGSVRKERDELKKELGSAVIEKDSMSKEVGELEAKVEGLERSNVEIGEKLGLAVAERDEVERLWRKKEEGFDALKEMMDDLEEEREEMGRDHEEEVKGLRAEIESNVAKISALEEEGRLVLDVNGSLEAEARGLKAEKDALRSKVIDLEQRNAEVAGELGMVRADLLELGKEKEAMESEFESKVEALELKLVELSKGMGEILSEKDEVETARAEQEVVILGLKKEIEKLRLDAVKLETMCAVSGEKNARLVDEKVALEEEFVALEKEMGEKVNMYEEKIGELSMNLDALGEEMRAVSLEKGEIEDVRARQEVEIVGLKKHVEMLSSNVVALEKEMGEKEKGYEKKIGELSMNLDALSAEMRAVSLEKGDIEDVRARQEAEIVGLKKQVKMLRSNVVALEKEMGEKEKGYEEKEGELLMDLDDLGAEMRAISLEKGEIEDVRAKQEAEIVGLKKDVEMLSSNVLELEEKCRCYLERTTQLQDERDAVERELVVQREESGRLRLQVEELKKSRDECLKELEQLHASLDELVSEKDEGKRCIESLTKELLAAKESSESLTKKTRAADVVSEKVISLLKNTAEAMNEDELAQLNGIIHDEEIFPFAKELESIKCAFKNRVAKIEEMGRELGVLRAEAENAKKKKKKPSLLMWLYPATTLIAAISVACAARGR